ncbi:WD40 repeat domain-containing protein [Endozoicomonas sp. 8E]|uniref:WD40 repeat domain-containing protein n=1 Tax=Endozoicomonas sp. 8E TaxID=3035692 RepID=UPI002938F869|nr:WD40 repeat domain-containing protein [Endozoicomonas sp. 8E]WOG28255.1 WD40 repeat domain-containing protein [Endozoicomonas sp. 8E]
MEKIEITHDEKVKAVNFSRDERRLATASDDKTATIYGLDEDEQWEVKNTISHNGMIVSATFSADGCNLVTVSVDSVKICSQLDDGSWAVEDTVHDGYMASARLSYDGRHLVTTGIGAVAKIYGQGAAGSWVKKATFSHRGLINSTSFSADCLHVVTVTKDNKVRITELIIE